jgi:hypothetical protein
MGRSGHVGTLQGLCKYKSREGNTAYLFTPARKNSFALHDGKNNLKEGHGLMECYDAQLPQSGLESETKDLP